MMLRCKVCGETTQTETFIIPVNDEQADLVGVTVLNRVVVEICMTCKVAYHVSNTTLEVKGE